MHHISHLFASTKHFILVFMLSLLVYGGAVLLLSPAISHAAGNTYYVATTGSNTTCGNAQNINTPARTFAFAITCLASGDTLLIRGGSYNEGFNGNTQTIPAGGGESTRTWIGGYAPDGVNYESVTFNSCFNIVFSTHRYITLDHLNINGASCGYNNPGITIG